MKIRNMVAIGFFSAIGMIGVVTASDGVASEMNQPDLIEERVGHGGSIYSRAGRASDCGVEAMGELIEQRVGQGGSMYYKGGQVSGCNVAVAEQDGGELVEERIGHGASIYSRRATIRTSDCKMNCGKTIESYSTRAAH